MEVFFLELWRAAKQAGPFSTLILLAAIWMINNERKVLRQKYDNMAMKIVKLAIDTQSMLQSWHDLLVKMVDKK